MILTIISALLTFTIASLYVIHHSLGSKLHAHYTSTLPPSIDTRIVSLPKDVLVSKNAYNTFYDRASRPVPRRLLPFDLPLHDLLIRLLRRNLATFSHFPQAWFLRLSTSWADKGSFAPGHIQSLEFNEGDRVCGVYRVAARRENQVEFEMSRGGVMGRLVIGYEADEKKGMLVFSSETVMWRRKSEGGGKIPLENPVVRFFHEMTAWWLMDSGVRFLMDLEGVESEERVAVEDKD